MTVVLSNVADVSSGWQANLPPARTAFWNPATPSGPAGPIAGRDYERWDCDNRGAGVGYGLVLTDLTQRYENVTTFAGETLNGTAGPDVIVGLGGDDTIYGRGGNDLICGNGGNDTISSGPGNDQVRGGAGGDSITGNAGSDSLLGEGGDDTLNGGGGTDTVTGGPGFDVCYAEARQSCESP